MNVSFAVAVVERILLINFATSLNMRLIIFSVVNCPARSVPHCYFGSLVVIWLPKLPCVFNRRIALVKVWYITVRFPHNMQVIRLRYISRFAILVLLSGFHSQWMLEHPKVLSCWWVSECWCLLGSGGSSWFAHICTPTVSIPFLLLIVDPSGSHLPHGIYPRLHVPHHRTLRWRFVGRTPGSTTKERRKCSPGVKDCTQGLYNPTRIFRESGFLSFFDHFL